MSFENNTQNDNSRVIFLYNDINEDVAYHVMQSIENLNQRDREEEAKAKLNNSTYEAPPIILDITSNGGSVRDGFNIISAVHNSKTPVYTRVGGYAYSMGFMIFLAGQERYISKYADIMYHQLSTVHWGTLKDVEEQLIVSQTLADRIVDYVSSRTSLTKKQLDKIKTSKVDKYYNAEEALKYNIATCIYN